MTELKPCPFAKPGEVHHTRTITAVGESWVLCSCGASGPTFSGVDSERKAIEAWNTRAERTCEIARVETGEPAEYDCDEVLWHCASCHEEVAIYAYNEDGDIWADKPAFCPNCGAKVVEL